ncbi:hypothetical protein ASPACDRAFT_51211 [Aspergillus aculeatus ATCC 16872]|uniref:Cytochrome P450 n=1 Tax=Aspergillus aculeatus (strain ATCC 16872 / CBS 172.66 / WB 5094) TaxID=690307 RepID=A0A1L9WZ08_ASPA1|nr:uncharacterized protein ASPACDRAFT_51211 [Aspergillus aculeatus ATCC 16872]OJK01306.1 hypothetical protein ASPACDRAFT_51211 [Aspergillus aculeatus ATCC 16872]
MAQGEEISPDTSPPELCWSTRKIAHSFFTTPFDFLAEGSRATESKVFRFLLDKNEVIVVSGEEARRTFFGEKALNLYQGFQALIGTIPTGLNPQALHGIYKRLNVLQKPDNLQHLLPQLLADCHRKMDSWDNLVIDPCSTVHGVTFQMIVRAVTSHDVAEDPRLVSRLKYFYDVIDASVKPSTSWPWVPSLATLHKLRASMFVYSTFRQAVKQRVRSGVRRDDTLQQLLDSGESTQCITGFMMGLPIAGARSTGTIGTWLLLFLAHEPIWSRAVRTEIEALLGLPTTTITTTTKPRETIPPTMMSREQIQTALSAVPLAAWESQTPRLDLCIRETLRRAQPHMAVRRNTGPDLSIGGFTIPSAAFVLYPFSDVALDPNLYPDPLRWDPARPIVDRDAFLGWGGGTHLCKGQRLATLILKIVVAYALICYEISLVGSDAALSSDGPVPDWNDYLTCRPRGDCTLRFRGRRK